MEWRPRRWVFLTEHLRAGRTIGEPVHAGIHTEEDPRVQKTLNAVLGAFYLTV